jgi:peptidyl-prolyl cis-trans isomerase C
MEMTLLSSVGRLSGLIPTFFAAGLVLAGPAAADGDVLARVNGKDITQAEVAMAIEVFGDQLAQVPEAQRTPIVLEALVDMHVMADAAEAAGTADDPKYKARMTFLKAQALRNTYVETTIQSSISDADIKARYDKDIASYQAPEEVHARHILVKTEDEAKAVLAALAGGADFATLAKEKSIDPGSKDNGGDLGFFSKGQMVPEFEAAAFALAPGETTKEPVKTQFGFHVIKVDDKRTQPAPTVDEVRDQVTQMIQRDRYQQALEKMRATATIERLYTPPAAAADAPAADAPAQPAN